VRPLDELRQMCSAPSDAYSAGQWCEAANDLLVHADEAERSFIEVCGEGMAVDAELARLQTIHDADCTIHYCQPPWRCSCGRAQAERAVAEAATLRQALEEIDNYSVGRGATGSAGMRSIARAALAGPPAQEPT
jgi:hypothetical protein